MYHVTYLLSQFTCQLYVILLFALNFKFFFLFFYFLLREKQTAIFRILNENFGIFFESLNGGFFF